MTDHSHDPHTGSDRGAAITGLIVGGILLFIVLLTIVKLTNAHYQHEKPAPAATQ
jgi:hypothetical protein